jgi:hypothetical protein
MIALSLRQDWLLPYGRGARARSGTIEMAGRGHMARDDVAEDDVAQDATDPTVQPSVQPDVKSVEATASGCSRRTLLRRSGTVAVGAAMIWSAPDIRTTALGSAAGTPAPGPRNVPGDPTDPGVPTLPVDPIDPGDPTEPPSAYAPPAATPANTTTAESTRDESTGATTGTLPRTGTDPRSLLLAAGGTLAVGSAIVAIVQDPDPARDQD